MPFSLSTTRTQYHPPLVLVVFAADLLVLEGVHVYTTVEIDVVEEDPEGGHCDLQFETEHLFPGQYSKQ